MNLNKYRIASAAAYPFFVQLEISRACSLRCPQCRRTHTDRTTGGTLPREIMEQMEPAMAQADLLGMNGWGESLSSPMIWDVTEAAHRHHVNPCLTTNGVLINEAVCHQMIDHRLGQLTISMDAGSPEGYRRFRPGFELGDLVGNIRRLARIKKERQAPGPHIAISFNFYEESAPEFPHYVRLAAKLPIIKAVVHPYFPPLTDDERRIVMLSSRARSYFEEGVALAQKLGVKLEVRLNTILERQMGLPSPVGEKQWFLPTREEVEREGLFPTCRCAWDFPFINLEGDVFPCNIHPTALGNLSEGSFAEVWNGERFNRFRRDLVTGRPNEFCLKCHKTMWYANSLEEEVPEHLPLTVEGLVGLGWYPVERTGEGFFRWSRGEATAYIRNAGQPKLYLVASALLETRAKITVNSRALGEVEITPEWGVRTIDLPEFTEEMLRVEIVCPEPQDDPVSYFDWCRLRLLGLAAVQIGTCLNDTDQEPQKALQSLFGLS